MPLHDTYARLTPFELAFSEPGSAQELVTRVDEEAAARGVDATDPQQFLTLGSVAAAVLGLQGSDAEPGASHSLGALLYHSVALERAGRPVYLLSTHAARYLVEGAPPGTPEPPAPSGYLQLPQHLFWAETTEDAPPESVDGLFWTVAAGGVLHALLATGMRPDRPGLVVVPLPEAPLADAPAWLSADVRSDGDDFAATLPGAELDRLLSFRAAGEGLKLLARFFAYVRAVPSALVPGDPPDGEQPRGSALGYTRVVLAG